MKDATTDPEQIRRRWQRWPDANIAIATGGASGIIALDVDPRHGGDVSLDMLEFEHDPLPATVVQHTPGGGKHYLFRHPGGTIRNSAGRDRRTQRCQPTSPGSGEAKLYEKRRGAKRRRP